VQAHLVAVISRVMSPWGCCTDCGMWMRCSLLRQGMDNLIVSLEGSGARAIEERADREGWSRDKIQEVCVEIELFSLQ
jgi:hypothetical protein